MPAPRWTGRRPADAPAPHRRRSSRRPARARSAPPTTGPSDRHSRRITAASSISSSHPRERRRRRHPLPAGPRPAQTDLAVEARRDGHRRPLGLHRSRRRRARRLPLDHRPGRAGRRAADAARHVRRAQPDHPGHPARRRRRRRVLHPGPAQVGGRMRPSTKNARVLDFGPVRTDGSVFLHRDGPDWVLRPFPRDRPFTVESKRRALRPPRRCACCQRLVAAPAHR